MYGYTSPVVGRMVSAKSIDTTTYVTACGLIVYSMVISTAFLDERTLDWLTLNPFA